MGYLSCRAQSAVAVSNSQTPSSSSSIAAPHDHRPKNPPSKIQHFQYSDLEAATNGFSDQKLLGKGSHGCVYKAVLRSGRLVAVKRPSRGSAAAASAAAPPGEVDNEIDILSTLHSPRLVNLVGFSNDSKDRLLVVEFMCNGTLYDVLHSSPRPPNWGRRIRLALQTAKAVETLHSLVPPVIHRDIKSANVLIDRNFNARLGDFGLALRCHVDDRRLQSTPPAGTMGYLDPCYVTPENLSTKTDVFSFGILLLEILSGRKAIDVGYSPPSIVDWAIPLIKKGKLLAIYDPRLVPPRDPSVRKQLAAIAAKCVRSCRERRPSMKDIVDGLAGLSKLVPLHSWNGFGNPCMMVENVGCVAQSGNLDAMDDDFRRALRNPRRVYSDLGLKRNNLMDLMADAEWEPRFDGSREGTKSVECSSSFRVGARKPVSRGTAQLLANEPHKAVVRFRRNLSAKESSHSTTRRDEVLAPSRFSTQAVGHV